MKLVLQITLGVFLGSLASQLAVDAWHDRWDRLSKEAEEKLRAEEQKARDAQAERIRVLLMQGGKKQNFKPGVIPPDFVPDDAPQQAPQ
jgi:hypothetical protein